jgi:hypothetical protein
MEVNTVIENIERAIEMLFNGTPYAIILLVVLFYYIKTKKTKK